MMTPRVMPLPRPAKPDAANRKPSSAECASGYLPFDALVERVAELDAYSHNGLHQFPKMGRHLLCADIRAGMNDMVRLLVVAWKRRQKSGVLFDLDVAVELMRHRIRKAYRLGYINAHRLDVWMLHVDEIGRMLGAWLKYEGAKS
jgi:hypothetical protein